MTSFVVGPAGGVPGFSGQMPPHPASKAGQMPPPPVSNMGQMPPAMSGAQPPPPSGQDMNRVGGGITGRRQYPQMVGF